MASLAARGSLEKARPARAAPRTLGTSATGAKRDRDSAGAELSCGRSRIRTHGSTAELLRLSGERARPRKPPHRSALLIDRDDRAPALAPQDTGELAQLTRPGDVAAEQDHAGDPALPHGLAHVVGCRRPGEAQHEQLTDLLLERQLVDRAACLLALLEHDEAEHQDEQDGADDHLTYVVNSTTLPSRSVTYTESALP